MKQVLFAKNPFRFHQPRLRSRAWLLLLAGCLVGALHSPAAVWTNMVSGTWGTAANWNPNTVPNGVDAIADFTTLALTNNATITNDAARTVGSLLFASTVVSNKTWTVDGSTNKQLTLATSSGQPAINVTNTQAILGGFNGINGFVKNGSGALAIYGKNYSNNLSGPIVVNGGVLGTVSGTAFQYVTGNITVASGATFEANVNGTSTISNNISLSGTGGTPSGYVGNATTPDGTYSGEPTPFGALDLHGSTGGSANPTVSGTVTLNTDSKITHGYNIAYINGPIVTSGAGNNLQLSVTVAGQYPIYVDGSMSLGTGALTVNSVSGGGSGSVADNCAVVLNSSNNFTGGTVLTNYGSMKLGNAGALGTGGLTLYPNTSLNLNTYGVSITSLSGTGGLITDSASGAGTTAIILNQFSATTYSGSINNGATRTLSLTLGGTGALALLGNNSYGGATLVNAGELIGGTGGSVFNSPVTVAAGATNGVQAVAYGAQWSCSSLTYNAGTTYLDLNLTTLPVSTSLAPLQVNGNLTANGTVNIIVRNGYWPVVGTYPLVSYTGSLSGSGSFALVSLPAGVTATLVNNTASNRLDLNVTAVPTVSQPTSVWTNLVSGNASGIWGANANWLGGTIPNATDAVANFTTNNITVNSIITNEAARTVGSLVFSNTTAGKFWDLDGSTNTQLTLATSLGMASINVTNTQVFLGGFKGSSGFVKNGNGVLNIFGNNYTNVVSGPILVNAGALTTANGKAFQKIAGSINVAAGATFGANQSFDAFTISNNIYLSGTGGTPSGYINSNTTIPSSPTAEIYNASPTPWGALDVYGNATLVGTITLNTDSKITHSYNNGTINGPIVATGSGKNLQLVTQVSGQQNLTVNGSMNLGTGTLTVAGTGTQGVALNAANLFSGGTILGSGLLQLGNSGALGSGGLTINGGYLNLNTNNISVSFLSGTNGTITDTITIAGTTTLTVNETVATTYSGIITNNTTRVIALTKLGSGSLALSGINTYNGLTTISNGTLIGVTGGSCANSIITLANNATNGIQVVTSGSQWTCAGLTNNGNSTLDFDFTSVAPSLGTAPLQINGNVTFNGTVVINARNGTGFQAGNNYPLYTRTGTFAGTIPTTVNLPPHVTGTLNDDGTTLWLDISANTEPLTWAAGDGFWNTSTPNWVDNTLASTTYQETFVGDAVVFDDTASGSGPFSVVLNQRVVPASVTVNVTTKTNYTIATTGGGLIAGPGTLTKLGTGSLTLSTSNSYTGGTVVSQGLLTVGSGGTLGAAAGPLTVGGRLDLGGSSQVVGTATFSGIVSDGSLTASSFIGLGGTNSANLAGSGAALTMNGTNKTLILSGTNTYTGGTTVSAGTLTLGSDYALGTGSVTVQSGAGNPTVTLNLNGHTVTNPITNTGGDCYVRNASANPATLTGPVTIGAYTRLGYYGDTNYGSVGSITIAGTLGGIWSEKQGAGLLVLAGTNTYTASTRIFGGVVRAAEGVGITTNNLLLSDNYSVGAVFESIGGSVVRALGAGANQVQLTNNSCGFSAYGAPATVSLGGIGSPATLTWGSTYFSVTNFILNYYSANAALTLANPIDLNGASRAINVDASVANINAAIGDSALSGAGLVKSGAGTLNLNGLNTYTGITEVARGALGGTGTLNGPLTLDTAATLAPGTAVIGTFTVSGSVSLNGAVVFGINRTNLQTADQLAASSVSANGPLTVNNLGPNLQANDSFQLFSGGVSGAFTATNLPILTGSLTWDTSALYSSGLIKVAGGNATQPVILPPYQDGSGHLVIRTATQNGYSYLLESTTNLTPPISWITNSTTAGTGGTITNPVSINPAQPESFFRYQVQ